MRLAIAAIATLAFFAATAPIASAAIVDDIIELYDPDLAKAKSAVQCVLDGGGIDVCTLKEGQKQLEGDGDFQNIMAVAKAVNDSNYPVLVEKAGLAAACAWIEFPGKDVACSELAGAVIDAGKEVASAGASIVKNAAAAAAQFAAAGAKAVVCLFSSCSSGSGLTVKIDGAAMWKNCYENTLPASLRARLGGSATWLERIDTALVGARFKPGSLAAACSNGTMEAQVGAGALLGSPEIQAAVAAQIRAAHLTMMAKYVAVVEQAAQKTLVPTAATYTSQKDAQFNKAAIAGAALFTQSGSLDLALTGERNTCIKALSTPEAASLSRWAEGANATNTASSVPGFTASGWPISYAPQPWCANAYVSAIQKDIVRRRQLRDQAVAAGCTVTARNPRHLTCPAVGAGVGLCQQAFKDGSGFACDRPAIRITPVPAKPLVTPPSPNLPANTTPPAPTVTPPTVKPVSPLVPRATLPPATTQTPPAATIETPKTGIVRPNCYP